MPMQIYLSTLRVVQAEAEVDPGNAQFLEIHLIFLELRLAALERYFCFLLLWQRFEMKFAVISYVSIVD